MAFPDILRTDNTHAREEVLNHRLLFELKIAAGHRNYHLLSYRPDVDHDGFDIILDDRDSLRKIQLKSVCNNATSSWEIHKGILRPSYRTWEQFGFHFTASWGTEGAALLMDVNDGENDFTVSYLYTDIYYISLIAAGVIPKPTQTVDAAKRIRKELQTGGSTEKTDVPKGLFLLAKNPDAVLSLAGFHSIYRHDWRTSALESIQLRFNPAFKMSPGEDQDILDDRTRKALVEANGGKSP